ncbi:MAG: hypothetical protein ACI4ST_02355 [Candidatus Gallimonas sp.]
MDEELDYAEMLEIPVETVTVKRKEKRKKLFRDREEDDLQDRLVEQVNDRMEEGDPAYAESKPIERAEEPVKRKREGWGRKIVVAEFVAVIALCATIFLTNIFMTNSAINTFVRGLFEGQASSADTRTYSDFKLSSVVNDYTDAEIAVSETGVLSFTAKCSVYPPCEGTVASVNGNAETGYTVELKHSDTFSSVLSGLSDVYLLAGETVRANLPLGFTNGESAVRVMFYSNGTLLNCYSVGENGIAWS